MLLWLMKEKCFGFWDSSHTVVYAFIKNLDDPDIILKHIDNALTCIEGGPSGIPRYDYEYLTLWPAHEYSEVQVREPETV